tara:strand:+ start:8961 stop:9122 length:162 start_codon:yes stop_codon:yes gene_type:complete
MLKLPVILIVTGEFLTMINMLGCGDIVYAVCVNDNGNFSTHNIHDIKARYPQI